LFELIYRFDPSNLDAFTSPGTAEEARLQLERGNREFALLSDLNTPEKQTMVVNFDPRSFFADRLDGVSTVHKQTPFAAVLACSDARVPTELVFGTGCNQLFVVRVAGNVLGEECLGSLAYAVKTFPSLKLIVVLAHARCGAVDSAVNLYLGPQRYVDMATNHAFRTIVDRLLSSVRVAALSLEGTYGSAVQRHPGYRDALLEVAVVMNAAWHAHCLLEEFKDSGIDVAFGSYDLISRFVRLPLSLPAGAIQESELGLFAPPRTPDEFRALANEVCTGALVKGLIS
jgi:carbonic anhydrase